ncbi:MAG: bifunctional folylpolyglutamate synthase/dihydrofolate synthase [Dehalococcoidia bacterium]|nr:bifunctional folylpolyglutamate synthase/dihydrofolate synthase [Dehalococcoidia bacterium]
MSSERYVEAVDYLQRRLWHDLPIVPVERALQGRIRALLAHFGDPHLGGDGRAYGRLPVLHVGGSAGKGSTATIAASVLQAAGLRSGLYTSPHLQTFIERIRVDERLIAPEDFADTVLGLEPLVRRMHLEVLDGVGFGRPALVEVAFATGIKHFADEGCDAAVIEVGLGGRTDCTNVFDVKPVTLLTNVDYEHRERLGWTLPAIAREKAALIAGGETVVTGATRPEALPVIEARCAERGSPLWRLGREVRARVRSADAGGSVFDLRTPLGALAGLRLPLAGAHQVTNAALAIAAAQECARAIGGEVRADAVREGLARVQISGRLELMSQAPRVLLDSAHNPVEARRLAEALEAHESGAGRGRRRRLHLVVGILADKDQPAMVRALARVADGVVVTRPPLEERAGDPLHTVELFERALGRARVRYEASPDAALDCALAAAAPNDVVCVTGTMFLVGALRGRWVPERQILRRRSAALPPA